MIAYAAGAFLKHFVQVDPRRTQGWSCAEQQAAEDAEGSEVAKDGVVQRELYLIGFTDVLRRKIEPVNSKQG